MKKENEEKYSLSDIIMLAVCTIIVIVCVIQLFLGFYGISYINLIILKKGQLNSVHLREKPRKNCEFVL